MPTVQQLQVIHKGARAVGLIVGKDDARYRLLLRNVAGVASARDLDNAGVEDVMAVLEDSGFDSHPAGSTYWRDRVRARSVVCGERMYRLILRLAAGGRYDLGAMCRRMSDGNTNDPALLRPREAWNLIEALKAIGAREQTKAVTAGRQGRLFAPTEAPERKPGGGTDAPDEPMPPPGSEPGGPYDDEVPF